MSARRCRRCVVELASCWLLWVLAWVTNQNVDQAEVWPRLFRAMMKLGYDVEQLDEIAISMLRGAASGVDWDGEGWLLPEDNEHEN
jgi:hypothetical protein